AHLAEFGARKLYLGAGFSSLFTYCTEVLHLSEHEAYLRITAARLSRRFPVILDKLESGTVNLTTLKLLRKVLTTENQASVLSAGEHKSKRGVEELVASVAPQPPVENWIRKLPAARTPLATPVTASASVMTPAAAAPTVLPVAEPIAPASAPRAAPAVAT